MPFFSIVLPTYNRAHFLPKAIESVISQTFKDWELIIVDDGSTDNSKDIIEAYKEDRIRYIYQENQERSAARNNGIDQAKGEFICFLDSDDYFLPEKLQTLKDFIDKSLEKEAVFYDGLFLEVNEEVQKIQLPLKEADQTLFEFLLTNPMGSMQMCIYHEILKKNKYDRQFRIGEDVELWLRIAQFYTFIPVKNSYNTVIAEHSDRSVNLKTNNSAFEQLKLLKYIFKEDRNSEKFNKAVRRLSLGICYFNIAKYFMYQRKKMKAIKWILKSLLESPNDIQVKHRIYCLIELLKFRVPDEYRV